jgi:polar amino acid transport system substrate-binding protein
MTDACGTNGGRQMNGRNRVCTKGASTTSFGLLLGACLAFASATPAPAETALTKLLPKEIQASGTLRAIANHGTPPMIFIGDDGKTLEGLEPELTQALAEALGVKIEYTNGTFDSLIPSIKSGRADFAVGSIGDLKKRQEQVDFVDYAKAGFALMVPKDNPKKLDGIPSLCGIAVAVTRGTYQEGELSKQSDTCKAAGKSAVNIQTFSDSNASVLALRSNRVDAWLGDSAPVGYVVKQSNGEFELAGSNATLALLGYAVSKDKSDIRDALEAGLEELVKNGKYKAIFSKWGQDSSMLDQISINNAYL